MRYYYYNNKVAWIRQTYDQTWRAFKIKLMMRPFKIKKPSFWIRFKINIKSEKGNYKFVYNFLVFHRQWVHDERYPYSGLGSYYWGSLECRKAVTSIDIVMWTTWNSHDFGSYYWGNSWRPSIKVQHRWVRLDTWRWTTSYYWVLIKRETKVYVEGCIVMQLETTF